MARPFGTSRQLSLWPRGSFQAEPLLRDALAIRERVLGPEHPDTAASLISLAALLNESEQARQLIERALLICEKSFGTEHPGTAHGLNNFARVLFVQGDYAGAQSLYKRALTI